LAAAARLKGHVSRTPVFGSHALAALVGATRVDFKAEHLQQIGAFKARGALNAVLQLPESTNAVVTHSSGNHGQAVAWAAAKRGWRATVVMPEDSAAPKIEAVRALGGEVVFCEPNTAAREQAAAEIIARTGGVLVHPYDDPDVIAGQGTAALELLEDRPDLDVLVVPLGGGGLAAGTCLAAEALGRTVEIFGAEPKGADDTARSLAAGRRLPPEKVETIADGLRTAVPGELTFPVVQRRLTGALVVDDEAIVRGMRFVFEKMKQVIEPSSATVVAAMLVYPERLKGKKVGAVLSGGNVDLDRLPWS
jgi:threonine dehydratase